MSSKFLNTLTDFLDNRTQRVILNCQYSSQAKFFKKNKLGFTSSKAEQPLQDMTLQEKEVQKD